MKHAFTWLLGAATASSWWAAAIWGYDSGDKQLSSLWMIPSLLTLVTLFFMGLIFAGETTDKSE